MSLLVGGGRGHFEGLAVVSSGKERTERRNSRYHLELVMDSDPGPSTLPCGPSRRILDLFVFPYMWLSNTAPTSALGLKIWVRNAFLSRQFLELQPSCLCFAKHN